MKCTSAGIGEPASFQTAWGVSLRPQAAADAPALRRLYGDLRAKELAPLPWSKSEKEAFLNDQFRLQTLHFETHNPGADFWVIAHQADDRIMGRLYLDRSTEIWRLIEIGLNTALQGKGLGRAIMNAIQEDARRGHARGIDLHVAHANRRAHAFYIRLGFQQADAMNTGTHQRMVWFS